jgi:ribosomal protein S12 methylthiotransferase accessory factor
MEFEHFIESFNRMFGKEVMENVVGSITGEVKFHGLTKTSMNLEGLDKHQRLIESYKKLHQARAKAQ